MAGIVRKFEPETPRRLEPDGMESVQDRMKQVFDALNLSIYQVAKDLGENSSKFYNILSGRAKPSYDTVMTLLAQYPQIRADFLLRGTLPVLSSEPEGKTNGQLVLADDDIIELPFVPIKFYASFVENITEGLQPHGLETYRVRKPVERMPKQPVVIEISGNSMSPQLVNGAKVMAVEIDSTDWEYQSGGVYAVIYRDYFVVKRIKENELLTRKILTLHSDHPNGGTVTVSLGDLRGIWKVVSIVEAPVE